VSEAAAMAEANARKILLADDDRVVRQALVAKLAAAGYAVVAAKSGAEALALFRAERPDLLILDVMMPNLGGYETCRRIRETDAETPILFLTALDSDASQLEGLGAGADDYVSKLVPDAVLLARVAAALRRARPPAPSGDFDFEGWRIDAAGLEMRRADGVRVCLSPRAIAVLRLFAAHPGEVFGRNALIDRFWGEDAMPTDNALTVWFHALRQKLGDDGASIESVRGSGYAYRPGRQRRRAILML
jgi:DNA-binding response OmpR family regulator